VRRTGHRFTKQNVLDAMAQRAKENQAFKSPPLKGTSLTADELAQHITKGEATSKAPHNKGIAGMTDAEAKSIAEFIKTLK